MLIQSANPPWSQTILGGEIMIVKLLCSKGCGHEVDEEMTDEVRTLSGLLAEERLCHYCRMQLIGSRREMIEARQTSINEALPILTAMSQELTKLTDGQLADLDTWKSFTSRFCDIARIMRTMASKFSEDTN